MTPHDVAGMIAAAAILAGAVAGMASSFMRDDKENDAIVKQAVILFLFAIAVCAYASTFR